MSYWGAKRNGTHCQNKHDTKTLSLWEQKLVLGKKQPRFYITKSLRIKMCSGLVGYESDCSSSGDRIGHSCGSDSVPGPGTSIYMQHVWPKNGKKIFVLIMYVKKERNS